MKIKNVEIGSIVKCNGVTAEVLSSGMMGTRVKITKLPKLDDLQQGTSIGTTIWSNETDVDPTGKVKRQPLTLFKG